MDTKTDQMLEAWEIELLNIFVGMFDSFGLPKSVAQIYGVLFCADEALTQDEICQKLQISTGSASQGLRLLTGMGAAHRQSIPGQRENQFLPERSMRRLLGHFIDVSIRPRMNTGKDRLLALNKTLTPEQKIARARLDTLLRWENKAGKVLPLVSKILS